MPRRYVGLGTCRAGHCCYCRLRSRVRSIATARASLPPPGTAATAIHHPHPSFVAMDTDMEPRDGKQGPPFRRANLQSAGTAATTVAATWTAIAIVTIAETATTATGVAAGIAGTTTGTTGVTV